MSVSADLLQGEELAYLGSEAARDARALYEGHLRQIELVRPRVVSRWNGPIPARASTPTTVSGTFPMRMVSPTGCQVQLGMMVATCRSCRTPRS